VTPFMTPFTGLGNSVALDSFDIEARWLKGRIEPNNEVIEESGLAQEIVRKIPAKASLNFEDVAPNFEFYGVKINL